MFIVFHFRVLMETILVKKKNSKEKVEEDVELSSFDDDMIIT